MGLGDASWWPGVPSVIHDVSGVKEREVVINGTKKPFSGLLGTRRWRTWISSIVGSRSSIYLRRRVGQGAII